MGYSIKILSSEEFEKLPFRHVDIALGVADPKTNTAYVRHSSYPELNKYLVDHEFEHLIEDHPTDEIDGVRYKILGDLFNAGAGALKSGGSALLSGAQNIGSGIKNVASNVGGGIMNLFKGGSSGGSASGSAGISGLQSGGVTPNYLSPQQKSSQNMMNFGTPNAPNFDPFSGQSAGYQNSQSGGGGILNSFKSLINPSTILGGLSLGAGLLKKNPSVPPLPDSVNQLRTQVQSGGNPLGQLAQSVVSQNLNKKFEPLTDPELTAATAELDRSRLQDLKRLEQLYASARPGTDYTTDTTYKNDLANLERNYSEAKSNVVANRTRSAEDSFNNNQYRNVQVALGASDQQMQQLAELAQLDIQQIMAQLQLDYASAQNFKQVFQNIGGQLLLSGLGAASPFGNFSAGGV